jgi:hypothetical protein
VVERFGPALRRVAAELDLPRGVRAAILMEMAADLEAVYEHHRRRGSSESEAVARAEATVLGSPAVIRRLGRLHRRTLTGWCGSVGARLSRGVGLALTVAVVAAVVGIAAVVAARALSHGAVPLVLAVAAVGALILGITGVEAVRLVRGDRVRAARMPVLLVLSGLAAALGVLALTLGVHATATAMAAGAIDGAVQAWLAARVATDGAALVAGLLLGMAGVLSWFVLVNRAAAQLAGEIDALLDGTPLPGAETGGTDGVLNLVRRRSA